MATEENGIPGEILPLDIAFEVSKSFVDPDDFNENNRNTFPVVKITDPAGATVIDTSNPSLSTPERLEKGKYQYNFDVPVDAEASTNWKITWEVTIFGKALVFTESFAVSAVKPNFGDDCEDQRRGYSFGNPIACDDEPDANYHFPNWGQVLTADEIRYDEMFGNRLTSSDENQTITDSVLMRYATHAIGLWERRLNIHIIPRLIRYLEPRNVGIDNDIEREERDPSEFPASDAEILAKMTSEQKALYYHVPEGSSYPYRSLQADHYMFINLDFRPLQKIYRVRLVDPLNNDTIDLGSWVREKVGLPATVQFFPNNNIVASHPFLVNAAVFRINYPYDDFPDAWLFDYDTGYKCADYVPVDLKHMIKRIATIMVMATYGDGKTSAIASSSANLNSISESISTTLSATSAAFGARIKQYQDEVKDWIAANEGKYSNTFFGVL